MSWRLSAAKYTTLGNWIKFHFSIFQSLTEKLNLLSAFCFVPCSHFSLFFFYRLWWSPSCVSSVLLTLPSSCIRLFVLCCLVANLSHFHMFLHFLTFTNLFAEAVSINIYFWSNLVYLFVISWRSKLWRMNNLLGFIFGGDADDHFFPAPENGVTLWSVAPSDCFIFLFLPLSSEFWVFHLTALNRPWAVCVCTWGLFFPSTSHINKCQKPYNIK